MEKQKPKKSSSVSDAAPKQPVKERKETPEQMIRSLQP